MSDLRKITWIGSSKEDIKSLPEEVQRNIGYTLHLIQIGEYPENVKPLKGVGSGVMEIVTDYYRNTYRSVYTAKLSDDIYVLHVFQKKSKHGIKTPQQEIALIKQRLARAKEYAKAKDLN
jgi:phage-related protein